MSVFNFNSGKNMSAYPQIQSDLTATNLNLHCDPRTVGTYFLDPQGKRVLDVESKAGKIAVEDDICNLTVNGNLTVVGEIILNGEILDVQGFLTNPLQVNIDANGKNITGAANIGASRVDTSLIFGAAGTGTGGSGGLMTIKPNGISTSTPGQRAQNLQIGNAEFPGDVIIETGGISGNNTVGQLCLQCTQQDLPGQYNINIGADMGVPPTVGLKTQFINIGTDNTTGANFVNNILIGNTPSSNLQFFSTNNVIAMSTAGGTKPSTLAAAGLTRTAIDTAAAVPANAIADITEILQKYGLIQ